MNEPNNTAPDENSLIAERRGKLAALRGQGIAFPNDFRRADHAGDLQADYADAARMMGMDEDRIQVFSDYQQVLDRMGGALEQHDVVLVKGSRFVELDRFVEGVC